MREQISGVYDQTLTSGAVLFVIFGRVYDKPQPLRTPSATSSSATMRLLTCPYKNVDRNLRASSCRSGKAMNNCGIPRARRIKRKLKSGASQVVTKQISLVGGLQPIVDGANRPPERALHPAPRAGKRQFLL